MSVTENAAASATESGRWPPVRVEILPIETLADIHSRWRASNQSVGVGMDAPDATNDPFWTEALCKTLLAGREASLAVALSGGVPVALFPFYRSVGRFSRLSFRELQAATNEYGGRCGILSASRDPNALRELLRGLVGREPKWGVLLLRTVVGSTGHRELVSALQGIPLRFEEIERERSPFIALPSTWEEVARRLHKTLRKRIGKGQRDLEKAGVLAYREIRSPEQSREFLDIIADVERRSWKDASGVSILANDYQKRFYEAMVPRAASAGRLSGHILSLNERPIAYMLGLLGQDRVYLALKSSFDESVAALSPGHVLKKLGICRLIERGAVAFDFMGRCDTHKMYWTDQTYEVATLAIYNASWRGRAAWLKRRIGGLRRTIPDEAPIPTRKDRDKPSAPAIKDNPGAGAGGTD